MLAYCFVLTHFGITQRTVFCRVQLSKATFQKLQCALLPDRQPRKQDKCTCRRTRGRCLNCGRQPRNPLNSNARRGGQVHARLRGFTSVGRGHATTPYSLWRRHPYLKYNLLYLTSRVDAQDQNGACLLQGDASTLMLQRLSARVGQTARCVTVPNHKCMCLLCLKVLCCLLGV